MRTAAMVLAVWVLVAGCSPLPPAGTRPVVAQVTNTGAVAAELAIETPAGVLQRSVDPSSLAAGDSARLTFFVPAGGDWWITVNGIPTFGERDVTNFAQQDCGPLTMEVSVDGRASIGC
jgi:hypothetical protein